jgi:hypothetical protein
MNIATIDWISTEDKNYKEILEMSMWQEDDYSYLDQQVDFCKSQFNLFFLQNQVIL